MPDVQEQSVPLVSETAAPEPAIPEAGEEVGAAAPSEAEPPSLESQSPEAAPQPASPAAPQPDDLLKDLLKLGG